MPESSKTTKQNREEGNDNDCIFPTMKTKASQDATQMPRGTVIASPSPIQNLEASIFVFAIDIDIYMDECVRSFIRSARL